MHAICTFIYNATYEMHCTITETTIQVTTIKTLSAQVTTNNFKLCTRVQGAKS